MEKKKRLEWVDAAKGIGILLIVIAHSIRPDMREIHIACKFIYGLVDSIAVGMFIVLSGVTYRMSGAGHPAKPGRFLHKKVQTLVLPFLGYALLIYAIFSFAIWCPLTGHIFQGTEYDSMPLGKYLQLTLCSDSPYAAHLWFIWVLFWVTIIVYTCDWFCECCKLPRQKILWCAAVLFYATGSLWQGSNRVMQRALTHTIYFVCGTELAVHPELLQRKNAYSRAVVVISAAAMAAYNLVGWHAANWYVEALWQICWLAVRLIIICSIIHLSAWLKDVKWLIHLGRESFWIYLLHQPFCGFVGLMLYNKLGLPIPLVCTVCLLLGATLPFCAIRLGRQVLNCLKNRESQNRAKTN